MSDSFIVTWNGNTIGEITDVSNDMWYMNGKWNSHETPAANEFETQLRNFDNKAFLSNPAANSIKLILFSKKYADSKLYCLAMSLNENELDLRMVVSEDALNEFFPNR